MNNQTIKFKILDKLSAFPNSELIEQVKDLVKSIDDDSPVFNIHLPPVDHELEAHIDKIMKTTERVVDHGDIKTMRHVKP